MARTARCPSCGASVEFKSAASVLAVCDYCRSTLIRHGEELENLGRMADLVEDRSSVQRGSEGKWQGRRFAVVGRIQLHYEHGLWNEWHLLFDDGGSGWLSEAAGETVISEPKWLAETLPAFAALRVGERQIIDGREYAVANVLTAECVAGDGELPFKVGAGYPAPVADLRDEAGGFATLDYSDDPARPLLFVGESVEFDSLAWSNLRQDRPAPEPTVRVRAFDCPSCGAPLKVEHENIRTVGCGSCGALIDPGDERVRQLERALQEHRAEPLLGLGSQGRLRGEAVEVIGFMRRHMMADNVPCRWDEYLLLAPGNKLLWLTEYQGHWNLARVLPQAVPESAGIARHEGSEFRHFAGYPAYVDYVIGEFPWRVSLDELAQADDFVAPPLMLSRERTASEVTWTLAEYIEPAEVAAAFKPGAPLRRPVGVFANQPNPHEEKHRRVCRRFWQFAAVALAIHVLLTLFGPGGKVLGQFLTFAPEDDEPKLTAEFTLDGKASRIEVTHDTSVDNNWVGLVTTLVNRDTGENWQASREISHYSGSDGDGSWSEGSRDHEVVFANLPPGRYVLAVESDMDAGSPAVGDRLTVARAGPRWSSLVLLLLFLVAFPVWTRVRRGAFEVRRWADSDHPVVAAEGGDD